MRSLRNLDSLKMADHGHWQGIHIGAFNAILGRQPFYRDMEQELNGAYYNWNIKGLREFNIVIFEVLRPFLFGGLTIEELKEFGQHPKAVERGKEIWAKMQGDVTLLQYLAQYGRETILGLMAGRNQEEG